MPTVIDVHVADITQQHLDVIVNPCNGQGGGGEVSTAIEQKWPDGTKDIAFGSHRHSLVKVPLGKMPCSYVMHVNCSQGADAIEQMLNGALPTLRSNNIQTIAFPIIRAGAAGGDYKKCSEDLTAVLCRIFLRGQVAYSFLTEVRIIVFDRSKLEIVKKAYSKAAGTSTLIKNVHGAGGAGPGLMRSVPKGSKDYIEATRNLPPDFQGMITTVTVRASVEDAAADALNRMRLSGGAAGGGDEENDYDEIGFTPPDIVLNQRDADGNLIGQIGMKKK